MGYSTTQINPEPLLRKQVLEVFEGSHGIDFIRHTETRCVLNLLKLVMNRKRFNIADIRLEVSDHAPKRYYLSGERGYIVFTLKE